jgi:hypothetical protein
MTSDTTAEKVTYGLDREDWLTLLLPAILLLASAYVAVPDASGFLRSSIAAMEGASQALIMVLLGAAAVAYVGIMNALLARWLFDHKWPSKVLSRLFGGRLLSAYVPAVAEEKFSGEALPYTAIFWKMLGSDEYLGEVPGFIKPLSKGIEDLIGPPPSTEHQQPKDPLDLAERRAYWDVASDVVKAWVLTRVGGTTGREAWSHAVKFRYMNDAYRNLSTAMPIGILVLLVPWIAGLGSQASSTGLAPAILLPIVGLRSIAVLGTVLLCAVLCQVLQVHALVNWLQWQGELCRLFFVTYSQETPKTPPSP